MKSIGRLFRRSKSNTELQSGSSPPRHGDDSTPYHDGAVLSSSSLQTPSSPASNFWHDSSAPKEGGGVIYLNKALSSKRPLSNEQEIIDEDSFSWQRQETTSVVGSPPLRDVSLRSPSTTTSQLNHLTNSVNGTALASNARAPSPVSTDYKAMEEEQQNQQNHGDDDEIPSTEAPSNWWHSLREQLFLMRRSKLNVSTSPVVPDDSSDSLMKDESTTWGRFQSLLCSSAALYSIVFVTMAAGLLYGAARQYSVMFHKNWSEELHVALIGSSYLFVNDVPRLLQAVSAGQVEQDSCLHSGGSLASLLETGNGMYWRWQTSEALIETDDDASTSSNSFSTYDFGACSVRMLLTGSDEYMQDQNNNGNYYYDDGNNPCLLDSNYLTWKSTQLANRRKSSSWDYVVLADQTKRMASSDARSDAVEALVNVYAPFIKTSGAIPAIVDTHAFWSSATNASGLDDLAYFTELIYEGVEAYADALASQLGSDQAPVIVPIGLAYLLVWEENYDLWRNLFMADGMHSSLVGSYLFAVVLYTKLFGHLSRKDVTVHDHLEYLYLNLRRTIGSSSSANAYPTSSEAAYLRNAAKRIVLDGYLPKSFRSTNYTR